MTLQHQIASSLIRYAVIVGWSLGDGPDAQDVSTLAQSESIDHDAAYAFSMIQDSLPEGHWVANALRVALEIYGMVDPTPEQINSALSRAPLNQSEMFCV